RYFPEPDLPPLIITEAEIAEIKASLPELPAAKRKRLIGADFSEQDAEVLAAEPRWEEYFAGLLDAGASIKEASTWLLNEARGILAERKETLAEFKVVPDEMAALIGFLREGKLTRPAAKELLTAMADKGKGAAELMEELDLGAVSDEGLLEETARKVIEENPDACERYHKGKTNVIGFLLGRCMAKLRGKADPKAVREMLMRLLSEGK
ncbi:hypothetical protein KAX21_04625, partial [candidate division WOR-3 bacterium]|nr:hypothetical protein [candidate division WOR-3 bacterium]